MLRAACLLIALWLGSTAAVAQAVIGQPPKAGFEVSGWRSQWRGSDVFAYTCEENCNPSSAVSYRLYGDDFKPITVEQFREQQRKAVEMLQARLPDGAKIEILAITEERKDDTLILKSHRLTTVPDGRKEYVVSSFVFGAGQPFSLISSADNDEAAKSNFDRFLGPMMLMVRLSGARR